MATELKDHAVYYIARDVKNPDSDRRRKYDFHSMQAWPAGTLLYARNMGMSGWRLTAKTMYGDVTDTAPGWGDLVAALEPANDLEAVLYKARCCRACISPEDIIQELIDGGAIYMQHVLTAVERLEAKDAERF